MSNNEQVEGKVRSYSMVNGFGFLSEVPGYNHDIHFRREDLPGQLWGKPNLLEKKLVFCVVRDNKTGKCRATHLQDPTGPPTFTSTVRSWTQSKGFGFIACPKELEDFVSDNNANGGRKDIFMGHRNFIDPSYGQRSDLVGAQVMFSVDKNNQGLSAINTRFPGLDKQANMNNNNDNNNTNMNMNNNNMTQNMMNQMMNNMSSMMNNMNPFNNNQNQRNNNGGNNNQTQRLTPQVSTGLKRGNNSVMSTNNNAQKRRKGDPDKKYIGHVTSFTPGKYGFVKALSSDFDSEFFFLAGNCGNHAFNKGDVVTFNIEMNVEPARNGKQRALNIEMIEGAPNAIDKPDDFEMWAAKNVDENFEPMENVEQETMIDDDHANPFMQLSSAFEQAKSAINLCSSSELKQLNMYIMNKL